MSEEKKQLKRNASEILKQASTVSAEEQLVVGGEKIRDKNSQDYLETIRGTYYKYHISLYIHYRTRIISIEAKAKTEQTQPIVIRRHLIGQPLHRLLPPRQHRKDWQVQ